MQPAMKHDVHVINESLRYNTDLKRIKSLTKINELFD